MTDASARRKSALSQAERLQKERDELGRLVRQEWVSYCLETGVTKPTHLVGWDELPEYDKEADRRIGEAVAKYLRAKQDE